MTSDATVAERPAAALSRLSLPWLVLCAAVAAFGLSGALTALLPAHSRLMVGEWGALALFLAGAIPLALIDARSMLLPNRGTLPLAAALAGYWLPVAIATGQWGRFVTALACAAGIFLIGMIVGMLGTLSFGDIKFMLAIGLLTGWIDWSLPLIAVFAGYVLALPHAIIRTLQKSNDRPSTAIPLGPYLASGAAIVYVFALVVAGGVAA